MLGQIIPWQGWTVALVFGAVAALLGLTFFTHARDEFADAL
jgi:ABC-type polysaccharide/polyol phosphate export permease